MFFFILRKWPTLSFWCYMSSNLLGMKWINVGVMVERSMVFNNNNYICRNWKVSHLQSLSLGLPISLITGMEQDLPRRPQFVWNMNGFLLDVSAYFLWWSWGEFPLRLGKGGSSLPSECAVSFSKMCSDHTSEPSVPGFMDTSLTWMCNKWLVC